MRAQQLLQETSWQWLESARRKALIHWHRDATAQSDQIWLRDNAIQNWVKLAKYSVWRTWWQHAHYQANKRLAVAHHNGWLVQRSVTLWSAPIRHLKQLAPAMCQLFALHHLQVSPVVSSFRLLRAPSLCLYPHCCVLLLLCAPSMCAFSSDVFAPSVCVYISSLCACVALTKPLTLCCDLSLCVLTLTVCSLVYSLTLPICLSAFTVRLLMISLRSACVFSCRCLRELNDYTRSKGGRQG